MKLHEIPQDEIENLMGKKESFFWKRDFSAYLQMVKSYQKKIKEGILADIDFTAIYQLFEKEKLSIQNSTPVLSHGDFTLANFVASKEKLIVTDWEQAHLDNFVYDFSHLWIQLWRYPNWQKELISNFLFHLSEEKKEEFKRLFRPIIISEALGELCWSIDLCDKRYRDNAIKAAQKTIRNSLKNFNHLIGQI